MIPYWSQDDYLQGDCKLFKITTDCGNVIEFDAQEFPSLNKNLGTNLPFCALIIFFIFI